MSSALVLQRSIPMRESAVSCCEWSPSARMLAVGLQSGDLKIIDRAGKLISNVATGDAIQSISWSPDEKNVAIATAWDRVLLLNPHNPKDIREFSTHYRGVWAVAFSPDGSAIASGGSDGKVMVYSIRKGTIANVAQQNDEVLALTWLDSQRLATCTDDGSFSILEVNRFRGTSKTTSNLHFSHPPLSVGVSNDGQTIAVGSKGGSIFLITDPTKPLLELEGHTDWVWSVSFGALDRILISDSEDNTIKFWNAKSGSLLTTVKTSKKVKGNIAIHSNLNLVAIPNDQRKVLEIWSIDVQDLLIAAQRDTVTHYCSAKVALVGESNVGKSCLALRMAENRYEEIGTTHGMRFWPIPPNKLDPAIATPKDQKRDVILWDMGGQDEYRLIHQLFLHDTTVALILLDPTRGRTAFEEAEGWAKRLEKQMAGKKTAKLLVGTKMDAESDLIDRHGLDRLIADQNFQGFYPTSAKSGRGTRELGIALSDAIDWNLLVRTTRPQLFQTVRAEIENARKRAEIVLLRKELEQRV